MKLKKLFSENLSDDQIQGWNKAFKHPRRSIAKWFSYVKKHLTQVKTTAPDSLNRTFNYYMDQATPFEGSIARRKVEHLSPQSDLAFHTDDEFDYGSGYAHFKIWPDRVECDVPLPESVKERLIKMVNDLKWSLYDVL